MTYVTVWFKGQNQSEEKEFNSPKTALRFMYSVSAKGHSILSYRCDDPFDTEWLNRRFKL